MMMIKVLNLDNACQGITLPHNTQCHKHCEKDEHFANKVNESAPTEWYVLSPVAQLPVTQFGEIYV